MLHEAPTIMHHFQNFPTYIPENVDSKPQTIDSLWVPISKVKYVIETKCY